MTRRKNWTIPAIEQPELRPLVDFNPRKINHVLWVAVNPKTKNICWPSTTKSQKETWDLLRRHRTWSTTKFLRSSGWLVVRLRATMDFPHTISPQDLE